MTLTELNYNVRKFTPLAIITVLVLFMLFLAFQLLSLYSKSIKKEVVVSPTPIQIDATFSKIKPPIIPQASNTSKYTFVLDTLDGTPNVENATSAATVYFLPKEAASFGSLPKASLMAKEVGFNTEITKPKVVDNIATFDDGKNKLIVEMTNFNFNYDFVLTKEDVNLDSSRVPSDNELISQASNYLSRISRYPTDLSKGTKNVIYLNYNSDSNQVATLDSSEGANMAEIDFYRPDIDPYPIVTSTYYNSSNYVLFGFTPAGSKIIRSQVKFFEKSEDQTGKYPVRTAADAWQDVLKGKAMVVSTTKDSGEITVKKVFLAYYDPDIYQEYLQPVYVFLGDDKFVAYVPAVSPDYLLPE
jgi:hypothetical protein